MANRKDVWTRRARRVRFRLQRRAKARPRLSVFRSGKHVYAQVIDDRQGRTLAHASTLDKELRGRLARGSTVAAAGEVGKAIAERALGKGVSEVVFDRGGYRFHGRIKALAEAARAGGMKF
jgi:large subunit ribosomal protein L18